MGECKARAHSVYRLYRACDSGGHCSTDCAGKQLLRFEQNEGGEPAVPVLDPATAQGGTEQHCLGWRGRAHQQQRRPPIGKRGHHLLVDLVLVAAADDQSQLLLWLRTCKQRSPRTYVFIVPGGGRD